MAAVREKAVSSARRSANRFAARIGPTVCELEGPIPILKMSKTLMFIAARGTLAHGGVGGGGLPLWPEADFARNQNLNLQLVI